MLPFFTRALAAWLTLALLAGCVRPAQPGPTVTPLATLVPTLAPTVVPASVVPLPTSVLATAVPARPIVGFDPQVGGPGTSVVIFGSGYVPGAPVVVRLGFPQPVGEALASAVPDADGTWHAMLVIPEHLPSGDLITRGDMYLVVMDAQNQPLASAPFGFIRGAEPAAHLDSSWPGAGWTYALESDMNHDGTSDRVYFRAARITPEANFDDQRLAAVSVVASEIVIAQPQAKGMWELLRIDADGARSERELFSFGEAARPAAYLMALDPARGPFLHVLPLGADGRALGHARGLDWDNASQSVQIAYTRQG